MGSNLIKTMGESFKLFVGNLSYDATEDDVRKAFDKFQPSDVIIITDRETGKPRGFGFVTFSNSSDAEQAKSEMNGSDLMGRPLTVNDASAKKQGGGGPRNFNRYNDGGNFRGNYNNRQFDNYQGGGGYNGGGYNGGGYQRNQGGYANQGNWDNY